MSRVRAALLVTVSIVPLVMLKTALGQGLPNPPLTGGAASVDSPTGQTSRAPRLNDAGKGFAALAGGTISAIRVEGNQRIEEGTIRSYMLVAPGDPFDPDRLDRSLKTLYATGLFSDVNLRRDGSTLVVRVAENPIVNRIVFEGNHKLTDDNLRPLVQLRPRAVFTAALAQADRQRILDEYAKHGRYDARVEPKIIKLDQNRVDVVFEINDGDSTLISRIAFVGNHAFSEGRLKEIINSRQEAWWRFLSTSDSYDPDRVNFDKELLRRFYLKNGFVDFQVTSSAAEISPDRKGFFISYTLDEGERYRIGKVTVNSTLRNQPSETFNPLVELDPGDYYDGDAVERTTTAISDAAQNRGDPFVDVKARISRNKDSHTVDLVFDVTNGPKLYVERIDITGNTRTKDKVVRREFRLSEGDAFNASLVRKSRQRLQDLGYFNTVGITTSPGSAPDKVIVNAAVDEKATGELTIGGGYSTDAGALLSAGLHEKNLIGTGIDAGVNGVLAQKRSEIDLSVTDPYFLDRNIVAGFDLFHTQNNNQNTAQYSERRTGFALRMGYEFNDHLRQALTYSLVDRSIYNVATTASLIIMDEAGQSLLSQVGQTLTLDYRDSRTDPHSGFIIRGGTDFAGLGGDAHFLRTKVDGTYFIPLDTLTGDSDWSIAVSGGAGYLFTLGHQEQIIDRFFLGGDNLRGFQSGGVGPHARPVTITSGPSAGEQTSADSIGGRLIYTQSTELRFPLPISPDLGLSGRTFVDVGALYETSAPTLLGTTAKFTDSHTPRVGAGVGVSWKTPFGLINIDVAAPVIKKKYDQTQVFRFGFGTRF